MEATRPAPLGGPVTDTAQLAKQTLRRLAVDRLEPTPENYARAWRQESGLPPEPAVPEADEGPAIATLIGRIVRGIERGTRGWTAARKKESLHRVLDGSRSDARRLQQRLSQLVSSWEQEPAEGEAAPAPAAPVTDPAPSAAAPWNQALQALGGTVKLALPGQTEAPHEIARALGDALERIDREGLVPETAGLVQQLAQRAGPVLQHRHHLLDQMHGLCSELTASLTDLAEDDSWARGQCEAMRLRLDEGLSARGVRAVSELLRDTRERQGELRAERARAQESLKGLINRMLTELNALGSQTGHFHDSVGRYADVIEKADSLESLAGVVREMVEESRTVQALVQQTQDRLQEEHGKAQGLTERVRELESEMLRLSNEVSTDQLTQVANRRGLMQAFDAVRAQQARAGGELAVGLLDIDNFKRLNDELGHGAGDEALRSLAAKVSQTLRPTDHVARYGGEEFVVLLPETPVAEGQQILSRLQRSLSGGLFMHEKRQVFVTFSAGVTAYRAGERIEAALERADQALYEAKRTGKNRTCLG